MTWPHHKDAHEGEGFRDGGGKWGVGSFECEGCGHGHGLPGCRMQEFGVVEQQEVKPLATT